MKNFTNFTVELLPVKAWDLNWIFMPCIRLIYSIPKCKMSKAKACQLLLPFLMSISVPYSALSRSMAQVRTKKAGNIPTDEHT